MIPGTHYFAPLLRQWRREKRLSQEQLAERAGINRTTLSRWERGKHLPSGPELDAILAALQATPEQAQKAFDAIQAPRAQQRTRARILVPDIITEQPGNIRPPVGGDLLRAMRRRRRRTQAEVARALGIQRTTLARWETSETWPDASQLQALCWELGAHMEEIAVLTAGRFSPLRAWGDTDGIPKNLEEFEEQMTRLQQSGTPATQEALSDLHHLIHLAGLWSLYQSGNTQAQDSLAIRYVTLGRLLTDRGRLTEAAEYAETALRLLADDSPSFQWVHVAAMLIIAEWEVYGDGFSLEARRDLTLTPLLPTSAARTAPFGEFRFRRGIRLLRSLAEATLKPELQTWVLAHMARYYAGNNQGDAAAFLAEKAARVLQSDTWDRSWEIRARQQLRARVLIHDGQAANALSVVSESFLDEMYRGVRGSDSMEERLLQEATLIRISALLHTGNQQEADTLLRQSKNRVVTGEWTQLPSAWAAADSVL